jgi:hypothetical protein
MNAASGILRAGRPQRLLLGWRGPHRPIVPSFHWRLRPELLQLCGCPVTPQPAPTQQVLSTPCQKVFVAEGLDGAGQCRAHQEFRILPNPDTWGRMRFAGFAVAKFTTLAPSPNC